MSGDPFWHQIKLMTPPPPQKMLWQLMGSDLANSVQEGVWAFRGAPGTQGSFPDKTKSEPNK